MMNAMMAHSQNLLAMKQKGFSEDWVIRMRSLGDRMVCKIQWREIVAFLYRPIWRTWQLELQVSRCCLMTICPCIEKENEFRS